MSSQPKNRANVKSGRIGYLVKAAPETNLNPDWITSLWSILRVKKISTKSPAAYENLLQCLILRTRNAIHIKGIKSLISLPLLPFTLPAAHTAGTWNQRCNVYQQTTWDFAGTKSKGEDSLKTAFIGYLLHPKVNAQMFRNLKLKQSRNNGIFLDRRFT